MKVLILTAKTGMGHVVAANSIEEHFKYINRKNEVYKIDVYEKMGFFIDSIICKGYSFLATKMPSLYGKMYYKTNNNSLLFKLLEKINSYMGYFLLKLVSNLNPDIIISTHPFATQMISYLKEKKHINTPIINIMTDYASHKCWVNPNIDKYVISNDDMIEELVASGVNKNNIHSYGIPIDKKFSKSCERNSVLTEIGLSSSKKTILMMAGSFGVNTVFDVYRKIINCNDDIQLIVVTGKNKSLYNRFIKEIGTNKNRVKLIYFTDSIHKLMKSVDMLITKPGGLTITEAIACRVPMVVYNAIPGQEEENINFLIKHNIGINLDSFTSIKQLNDYLLDVSKINSMKDCCDRVSKINSQEKLYNLCLTMI